MFHEEEDLEEIAQALEPSIVDEKLRAAVQLCWFILPRERRSLSALEAEVTSFLSRIFRELRDRGKWWEKG
jgi:hypothetical protein